MWNYKRTEKYWHIVSKAEFENFIQHYNPYGFGLVFGEIEIDENTRNRLWKQADTPENYKDLCIVAQCKAISRFGRNVKPKN